MSECPNCKTKIELIASPRPEEKCRCKIALPGSAIYIIFKDKKMLCAECKEEFKVDVGCLWREEKKSLAKKLYEAFPAKHPHNDVFEHLANVAEAHFFDGCEEELSKYLCQETNIQTPNIYVARAAIKFLRER